jgi:heme exporter protein D
MAFYERKETGDEVSFVYTYRALYYYALFLGLGSQFFSSMLGTYAPFVAIACIVVMVVVLVGCAPASWEIKKLLSQGASMRRSGNTFSFSNPLTIIVKKA